MSEPDLADAYRRLAEAVREVSSLEGAQGVLTEWVVVTAHQSYDDAGQPSVQIGQWMPDGGEIPFHRVMGLLDYALTLRRHQITE